MNPRPKPQPKPKLTNLMEEVISIKHDEGVVENPCLYRVAREVGGPTGSDRNGRESNDCGLLAAAP